MQRISLVLGAAWLLTACGGSNFNAFFASQEQKEAQDQLRLKAQYEFDQGNNDKALEITDEILKVNPYEEKTLILRSYAYLSLAGLDGFSLSKKMIEQNDKNKDSGTNDSTDTLKALAEVIGMTDDQIAMIGTKDETTGTKIFLPLSRTEARASLSYIMENIGLAVTTLCPIIQAGAPKNSTLDPRHSCTASPFEIQGQAKSHFAWALAHLSEAVAFFSVILYDDGATDATGKPLGVNIQRVSAKLDQTNPSKFIADLTVLTSAVNRIFPTDPALAADSMLNGMFNDLEITSKSFAAMGGVPESVTKSIDDVITNLRAQVSKVSTTTDANATSDAAKQNAAVRNELTKAMANGLETKINALPAQDKAAACALFKQINSDPSQKPSGC